MSNDDRSATSTGRPERRLAAILAADVVGYSGLMERDEEGTHGRLRALFRETLGPAIEAHRGRIVKTAGDGLIAEFASLVEAVRCAVALQQEIARQEQRTSHDEPLQFRIGVNLGDILVEQGDVFGDGVNVAARIESLAEPGAILVSAAVHEQVQSRRLPFRFHDLGERTVKNIARPLRVYRVDWDQETPQSESGPPRVDRMLSERASIAVLPFANMSSDPEQEYFGDGLAEEI